MFYISTASLVLMLTQFAEVQRYLGLPRNIAFAQTVKNGLEQLLASTLGAGRTETVVVALFWAGVGLAVYVLLHGVSKTVFELGQSINERRYVWPQGTDRNSPLKRQVQQVLFRVAVAVLALVWFLQPLARVLDGPVFVEQFSTQPLLESVAWFVGIVLALHVFIILLRLLMLRRRLFD